MMHQRRLRPSPNALTGRCPYRGCCFCIAADHALVGVLEDRHHARSNPARLIDKGINLTTA